MLDKTKLIKDLLSLVEEEQKYKLEYAKEHQRILKDDIAGWEREKFRNMRTPNNANVKDALKIIFRLSMQQVKEL